MVETIVSEGELRKEYQEKKNEAGELRMQLRALYTEKDGHFSQLRCIREQISRCVKNIRTVKEERDQLTGEVQKLKEERQKLNCSVQEKALQKKEVEEKKKELFQENTVYDPPQAIKTMIFHLEKKIETEVIPFSQEQQIRKKIKELKVKYKQIEKILQNLFPFIKFKKIQAKILLASVQLLQKSKLTEKELKRLVNNILKIQSENYVTKRKKKKKELLKILGLTP